MSKKLDAILNAAVSNGASDIHIQADARAFLRIKGELTPLGKDPVLHKLSEDDVLEIIYATMEKRPQAKEIFLEAKEVDYSFAKDPYGRFRVNAFTTMGKPGLVARLLVSNPMSLDDLKVPPVMKKIAALPIGLVLVTGETGSGKSTTLAAMIKHINDTASRRIFTIEDPVEILFENNQSLISQREVGADTLSFAAALKSVLREDPNVIFIGEIRNKETMKIAIEAASTGHLVFATLHTNSASETIGRILGFFDDTERPQMRQVLAQALEAVICQRLSTDVNGKRVAVMEIMRKNLRISEAIREEDKTHNIYDIIETGSSHEMQTFEQHLLQLVGNAIMTPEKALTVTTKAQNFSRKLKQIIR